MNAPVDVLLQRTGDDVPVPTYAHAGDAGVDLTTREECVLKPGERTLLRTGVRIALPDGYAAFVHPRSGLAVKYGVSLVNAPGTIDAGFRGEIQVSIVNLDPRDEVRFGVGDRIAQLVVQRVEKVRFIEVDELPGSQRDAGGFGSTGGHAGTERSGELVVAVFRRKKRDGAAEVEVDDDIGQLGLDDVIDDDDDLDSVEDADVDGDEAPAAFDRSHGPFDISEIETDAAAEEDDAFDEALDDQEFDDDEDAEGDEAEERDENSSDALAAGGRVDLGGMQIPPMAGIEIRINVDQESGQGQSVSLVRGQSAVQVAAFAAPRLAGIWDEVRRDIAASLTQGGGTVDEVDGPFGRELKATIRQGNARNNVRFVGVDGPRWFLRGIFEGQAASDRKVAAPLEAAFRRIVVVRGTEAMAPHSQLPIAVPGAILPQETLDAFRPPERGPEITEIR